VDLLRALEISLSITLELLASFEDCEGEMSIWGADLIPDEIISSSKIFSLISLGHLGADFGMLVFVFTPTLMLWFKRFS
jgi:hypothetical protein